MSALPTIGPSVCQLMTDASTSRDPWDYYERPVHFKWTFYTKARLALESEIKVDSGQGDVFGGIEVLIDDEDRTLYTSRADIHITTGAESCYVRKVMHIPENNISFPGENVKSKTENLNRQIAGQTGGT